MLKDYRFILTAATILVALAMAWGRHQAQFTELKSDTLELRVRLDAFKMDARRELAELDDSVNEMKLDIKTRRYHEL